MPNSKMNKLFKISSILVVVIGVAASLVPSFALAAGQASFSQSGMFTVGNHAYAGTYNWTTSLTNMKPGDQVAFEFTFLNNSSVTAIDAKSSYSATGDGNHIRVTGTIWAQNAPSISQSVDIYAAPGYTISLSPMSASFGGVGDVLPGSGNIEYYTTGLYSITGQSIQQQQPTANLWAEYPNGTAVTQVSLGTAPYLHWTSTNATECHALAGAGFSTSNATQGQDQVSPLAGTTTFSIQCTNSSGGSIQANATVSVINNPPPVSQPTANISAYPTIIGSGNSSTIQWSSNNATECHATRGNFSTVGATSGSASTGVLYSSTTYSISCSNSSGSATDSVTVSVSNPPAQYPTANISANPTTVTSGGSSTLNWSSTNATECHATGGNFSTGGATSGSVLTGAIYSLTTYSISCSNSSGLATDSVTVQISQTHQGSAPLAITNSASDVSQTSATLNGSVNPNSASTSYWFEYGTSQSLGNTTSAQSAGNGTSNQNVLAGVTGLSANTTYYFRVVAQNSYGTTQGSVLSFTTANGGGGGGNTPIVVTGGTNNLSQSSAQITGTVNPNSASTSYWFEYGTSQSLGNSTGFQSAGSGNSAQPYSASLSNLSSNTTYYYRIVAQNSYGTSQGSILSFTTNGGSGGSCSSPMASSLSVGNVYQNSAQLNGQVNPNNCSTNYWFEYGASTNLGNMTSYQSAGSNNSSINVSTYISGLNYNTTYYYRVVAQNSAGTAYGSILSFSTNNGGGCYGNNCYNGSTPYVQTNSSNVSYNSATLYGQVNPNGGNTYAWFEYGTNYNYLGNTTFSQSIGSYSGTQYFNQSVSGLSQGTTYYYRAAARNDSGTTYGQILSFSTGGNNNYNVTPLVITNQASYIYQTSALLNGQVNPNGNSANGWFEYGTTMSLGSQTVSQPVGAGSSYANLSTAVSGLAQNTTYYYRAVAQNGSGTAYGSILSFTTAKQQTIIVNPVTPTNPIIVQPTTTGLSCLMLVPSINVSQLTPGQHFVLTITYRNGCTYNLSNAFLKVILPPGTEFSSTNYPFFNHDANGISYNLGAVAANFQSAISIDGIASDSLSNGDTVIFSSVLNFNDVRGRFQSISAYLTSIVGSGPALGATVITAFGALLGNWIFDLILFIALLFLIYWIFFRKDTNDNTKDEDVLEAKPFVMNK